MYQLISFYSWPVRWESVCWSKVKPGLLCEAMRSVGSAHRQGLLGQSILPLSKSPAFSAVKCVNVCENVCRCVCRLQQSKPAMNATRIQPDLSAGRQREYESVRDLTRTIFQSILRHLFLWFYLISAYCLPCQMFLPFNCTLLLESGLCKAIKMLFLLSFIHTHPHALSLEPFQTLYRCLNLLKIIKMISTRLA